MTSQHVSLRTARDSMVAVSRRLAGQIGSPVQGSIKKAISVGILCLSGLLILHLEAGNHVLAVWLSLTMMASVLLFGGKDGPRLYIQRRPSIQPGLKILGQARLGFTPPGQIAHWPRTHLPN